MLTITRCVVAPHKPPVMASKPCWMFTTNVLGIGGASIHTPTLFKTCNPPTESCDKKVNSPVESLCGPTPKEPAGAGGYFTSFKRSIPTENGRKVSAGKERHSPTRCRNSRDSFVNASKYSSSSGFKPSRSGNFRLRHLAYEPQLRYLW